MEVHTRSPEDPWLLVLPAVMRALVLCITVAISCLLFKHAMGSKGFLLFPHSNVVRGESFTSALEELHSCTARFCCAWWQGSVVDDFGVLPWPAVVAGWVASCLLGWLAILPTVTCEHNLCPPQNALLIAEQISVLFSGLPRPQRSILLQGPFSACCPTCVPAVTLLFDPALSPFSLSSREQTQGNIQ